MEQLSAFVLGVLSVVAIATVVRVFKIKKTVALMIEDRVDKATQLLHSRIDDVDSKSEFDDNKLYDEIQKLYAYIDSRVDKLADSKTKTLSNINLEVDKLNTRLEDIIARQIADLYSHVDSKFNDNAAFTDLLHHRIKNLEQKS